MTITSEEVKKLASLSRISLSDEETDSLSGEIDSILGYVAEIDKAVSGDAKPEYSRRNIFREDDQVNTSGEYSEKLLSLSPDREGGYIKVKKIL